MADYRNVRNNVRNAVAREVVRTQDVQPLLTPASVKLVERITNKVMEAITDDAGTITIRRVND